MILDELFLRLPFRQIIKQAAIVGHFERYARLLQARHRAPQPRLWLAPQTAEGYCPPQYPSYPQRFSLLCKHLRCCTSAPTIRALKNRIPTQRKTGVRPRPSKRAMCSTGNRFFVRNRIHFAVIVTQNFAIISLQPSSEHALQIFQAD